jgi:CRP/FNR family transcriptional regulator, cyclic AMP receptor protein
VRGTFARALSEPARSALLACGRRRHYSRNSRVFCEGDRSDFVVVIHEGRVKILAISEEGAESILGVRGPGELVGELAAFDAEPRSASVIALEPLTVQVLTAEEFRSFLVHHADAAVELMRMLIGRLREADRRRVEFGSHDAAGRVAHLLADLAAEEQPRGPGPVAVQLSQQEIGDLIGASRESVARALATLRDRHLVRTSRRSVTVLKPEALRTFTA